MEEFEQLVTQTIQRYVRSDAQVERIVTAPMRADEHGYSGAHLGRHTITYRSPDGAGNTTTLVTKAASLTERRVLHRLTSQEYNVPFSHTLDLATDGGMLVCQQDLRRADVPTQNPPDLQRTVACGLARLHFENRVWAQESAWLPRANHTYFEDVILTDFRTQLARAMYSPAFAAQYEEVARQMEEAIKPFLHAMDSLWARDYSLTLIHADLMDTHILVQDGRPYLIDWGQARYGSFYLDLPNYLTPESSWYYRNALAELGLAVPEEELALCYAEAGRYPGFKYMGFLLHLEAAGRLDSLHGPLLQLLLHGAQRPLSA